VEPSDPRALQELGWQLEGKELAEVSHLYSQEMVIVMKRA
jgi:hypothetical protein